MATIIALSSGAGRAGVAVVRLSGPAVRFVCETLCGLLPATRFATLVTVRDPVTSETLDRCLALRFEAPASATGEDVLELHLHGGPAVVKAVIDAALALSPELRLAEAGEFTRRALENGKLDLLEVEAWASCWPPRRAASFGRRSGSCPANSVRRFASGGTRSFPCAR